jgi:hypothetical protein
LSSERWPCPADIEETIRVFRLHPSIGSLLASYEIGEDALDGRTAGHGGPGVETPDDRLTLPDAAARGAVEEDLAHDTQDGHNEGDADHDGQRPAHEGRLVAPVTCLCMAALLRVAPILPTADINRMQAHYEQLGFTVRRHDDSYATASRDGIDLHFRLVPDHDPLKAGGVLYLAVDDADALHAEWLATGEGQTSELFDPGFGVWEAAHTDPDGNLLRFGSPLRGAGLP